MGEVSLHAAALALMQVYFDEDLSDRIARALRERGIDATSSHELGRDRLPDDEQLRLAAIEGRVLVTRNAKDFIRLTHKAFEDRTPHTGVLIAPRWIGNQHIGSVTRALEAYAHANPDGMDQYTYDFLKLD